MLSWLPILGPILQGIINTVATIYGKSQDTSLGKYTVDGNVKMALDKTDEDVIQTRAQVAIAFKDDLGVQLCRDLVLFPGSLGIGLYFYNWTFKGLIPTYTWDITVDNTTAIYLASVIAFLLVTAWRGR